MKNQIYLMLVRKVNPVLTGAAKAAAYLKNFVAGDSLDVPFMKFIRVQSTSHSIGFAGEQSVTERVGDSAQTFTTETGKSASGYNQLSDEIEERFVRDRILHSNRFQHDRWGNRNFANGGIVANENASAFSSFKKNQYVNINLPAHDDFTFTKYVDNSTPQLAYGCTAQEPFSFAAFFYRRRIGVGIKGVRLPYLTIGLNKCLISSWSLADDMETVKLSYKDIVWATYDQIADINAPTGMSSRIWDTESKEGGEKKEAYIAQALVGLLATAGGILADQFADATEVTDG